jgi:hypothetical protein
VSAKADVPELVVADAAAWRAWLEAHHQRSDGDALYSQRVSG